MYLNAYYDREEQRIHIWDDVKDHYSMKHKPYAYVKTKSNKSGLYSVYGEPVKRIQRWSRDDEEKGNILESDVPVLTRALIDEYADSDEPSDGHRELIFDIECSSEGGFPDIKTAQNEITAIGWYDKSAHMMGTYILDETNSYENYFLDDDTEVRFFKSEEDLVSAFLLKWAEIRPTIVSGWNIEGFDIPYLYHRARNILGQEIASLLSPIKKVLWNEYKNMYKIAGISVLDYLGLYKKFTYTQQSSYNLDAIGKLEVGMGKVKYDGSLDNLFKTDIDKFIEYNLCDVLIVKKIDDKMKLLDLVKSICHKAHIPYEDVYYSSRVIDGAILTYLRRLGIVTYNKKFRSSEDAERAGVGTFSGAFVKEPNKGRYFWIYDLDMTSLYPSVIMSLNISPETKIGRIDDWDAEEYVQQVSKMYTVHIGSKKNKYSTEELKDYLDHHKYSVSINGVLYKTDKFGIIPSILDMWFKERVEYKSLMQKYGKEGDEQKYQYFKDRQHTQKILLNSVYGVLGLPTFRFYDSDNAAAVTTTGVALIRYAEKMANHYYNKELETDKDYCIYIDTDSTFFSSEPLIRKRFPGKDFSNYDFMSKETLTIASDIQQYLNASFHPFADRFLNLSEHRFDIKQEVIARAGLWVAKKRYALWITNDNGVPIDKVDVKGLDVVRSNFPKAFATFLKGCLDDVLKDASKRDIDSKVLSFKRELPSLSMFEIAIPTGIKGISKYTDTSNDAFSTNDSVLKRATKGTPVHVKATINYNNILHRMKIHKHHEPLYESEKIRWVYLKDNPYGLSEIAFRGYDDPPKVMKFIQQYVDYSKIFERILWSKLEDIYDSMKWEHPSEAEDLFNKFFS